MRRSLLVFVVLCSCAHRSGPAGQAVRAAEQLVVVRAPSWQAQAGELRRYQRGRGGLGGGWVQAGDPVQITLGKGGLGWGRGLHGGPRADGPEKREGDGRAPAGAFSLGPAFGAGQAAPPGARLPYLAATEALECVDDPASPHYNQLVKGAGASRDWTSSEHLRRPDELYDLGVVVQHNTSPAAAGAGSCIFLHVARPGRATVGCTAMARPSLDELLRWLDPAAHPVLVQLPEASYQELREAWALP